MEKKYFEQAIKSKHWEKRTSPVLQYYDFIKKYISNIEGKKLLDVGCAEGVEVNEFRKLGLKADGVDIEKKFIEMAQKKFPQAKFVEGKAESLPFADQSYDIVFSINTLFLSSLEKSISEFCRVLKENGRGVISFDTEIFNFDENKIIHSDSIEHLEEILKKAKAEIEEVGEPEERIDNEPFKHKHIFHKIIFKKIK